MGLDNIVITKDMDEISREEMIKVNELNYILFFQKFKKVDLMRGIVAGYIPNALRGSRYHDIIYETTKYTLYGKEELLKMSDVKQIYEILKKKWNNNEDMLLPENDVFSEENREKDAKRSWEKEISEDEKKNLVLFFQIANEYKCSIWCYS
jgi:hypothetical protein